MSCDKTWCETGECNAHEVIKSLEKEISELTFQDGLTIDLIKQLNDKINTEKARVAEIKDLITSFLVDHVKAEDRDGSDLHKALRV